MGYDAARLVGACAAVEWLLCRRRAKSQALEIIELFGWHDPCLLGHRLGHLALKPPKSLKSLSFFTAPNAPALRQMATPAKSLSFFDGRLDRRGVGHGIGMAVLWPIGAELSRAGAIVVAMVR